MTVCRQITFASFFVQKIWGFIAANVKVFSNKISTLFLPTKNKLELNSSLTQYSRFAYHITPKAGLSPIKSTIAENGMGMTSKP